MELEDIKQAVNEGKTVCYQDAGYVVVNGKGDNWLIKCLANGRCVGLVWDDGVTMNGSNESFYIA